MVYRILYITHYKFYIVPSKICMVLAVLRRQNVKDLLRYIYLNIKLKFK